MYDVIVVGARCAGSPTAMLLARQGYQVLLVDRATFPSPIVNGHYIHQPGVAALTRWGLLDRLRATRCPPIVGFLMDVGPATVEGRPPPHDGVAEGFGPRRTALDKMLVDAAVEAGVEVREGCAVQELLSAGGWVNGIRAQTKHGTRFREQAPIVIGADGQHSLVARTVQAQEYETRPALTFCYYSYWSGVPLQKNELYVRDRRTVGAFPTNDGLAFVWMQLSRDEFGVFRADLEGSFSRALDLAPSLAARVRAGKREERFFGTAEMRNFFRKPHGPGWALVGDAGYHKDPITAQGITDAFRDAELLAATLDAGFSGREPLEGALAGYERARNQAVMPMYEMTCQQALLAPSSGDMPQLFAALQDNREEADRFFGTLAGTVPIPEFFAPENIARIIRGA